jgi:hypothetical protein
VKTRSWHAEQGADALFQQDRVQHMAVVDLVQDDRPLIGGDAAGEARADRDPDALGDLFLKTAGRGGDQLTSRAVKQQHRGGIGIHRLPHPAQQRGEEVTGVEVGQRRIRHRPDVPELVVRVRRAQRRYHQQRITPAYPRK